MNRDALLATIIGFGVGLLIMGILLVGPNLSRFFPNFSLPNLNFLKGRPQANPTPSASPVLTIDSPLADAIESTSDVLISGKAASGATIVIQGALDEIVTQATEESTYAGRIKLTEGANEIVATMYNKTEVTSVSLTIYYTPEEF